jgi:hypothetical protein
MFIKYVSSSSTSGGERTLHASAHEAKTLLRSCYMQRFKEHAE